MFSLIALVKERPRLYIFLKITGLLYIHRYLRDFYHLLRYGRKKEIIINGMSFMFPIMDNATRNFFFDPCWLGEIWEKDVVHHFIKNLEGCSCFIDIGAHVGFYSLIAAKIIAPRGGVVHAVEMDLDNITRLKSAIRLNNLNNITVHHAAIGDHQGEVEYSCCGAECNTLNIGSDKRVYTKRSVQMITLDNLVATERLNPDIIKIDVEGAEYLVLLGMRKALRLNNLKIYCEAHLHQDRGSLSSFGHSPKDVVQVLKEYSYTIEQIGLKQGSKIKQGIIHDLQDTKENVMLFIHR
ncbi:MAG: FkbM family methyltransferase [Candidatus Omnitrophota bacterium]